MQNLTRYCAQTSDGSLRAGRPGGPDTGGVQKRGPGGNHGQHRGNVLHGVRADQPVLHGGHPGIHGGRAAPD